MAKNKPGFDPYTDPETGVLYNRRGLSNQTALDRFEAMQSARGAEAWAKEPGSHSYDLNHLRAIHRQLFGKVYTWAGDIRTVPIEKGTTRFAQPEYIESAGRKVFAELQTERPSLIQGSAEHFGKRAAHYLGELNALHPFREGNGRTQRAFVDQLASEAGYRIDWKGIEKHEMAAASEAAMYGDTAPMESLLTSHIKEHTMGIELQSESREGMNNDQMSAAVDRSKVAFEDAIPPAEGRLSAAMEADKARLNLQARSYAKDHPKQYAINRSRMILRAVEVADAENRKEVNLMESETEKTSPNHSTEMHKEALGMVRETLDAAEKHGMQIKHELSKDWKNEACMEKGQEMGMGYGKE